MTQTCESCGWPRTGHKINTEQLHYLEFNCNQLDIDSYCEGNLLSHCVYFRARDGQRVLFR
jgi:hypothetical protein